MNFPDKPYRFTRNPNIKQQGGLANDHRRKIREARKQRGLFQEQLAEKLNVSRQAIAKWETDKGIPDIANRFHWNRRNSIIEIWGPVTE